MAAVDDGIFSHTVQDGVVAVAHMLGPSKFGERRILALADVVEFVRVAIGISRMKTFAYEVGIVVIFPLIPIGQLRFKLLLTAVESRPVDVSANQGRAPTDHRFRQSRPDIYLNIFHGIYGI